MVGAWWHPAAMGEGLQPFIGSEALALGRLSRHELRQYYRPIMPNIYLDKRIDPSLRQRILAAHLWSRGEAVVSGLAASAMHGTKWIDDNSPVELICANARPPSGVVTRKELLLANEIQRLDDLAVTTPERTAFDLGRRGRVDDAVALLDSLARVTHFKIQAIGELAARHKHTRGLRQLEEVLLLVDAGAESPRETRLRLILIRAGYPRPETQIPVLSPDGFRQYYLDMGWRELMLAVEYEGDHHRTDRARFAYEIERAEDIRDVGWLVVRVAARNHPAEVLRRVQRAWNSRAR
jgi:hypothetical protein